VVDRNDRGASHKLNVQLRVGQSGRIRTHFREPYTAPNQRYSIDVRYSARGTNCQFRLSVNGHQQGPAWKAPEANRDWNTQTIPGVRVERDDEITIDVQGGPECRLDYVQLNVLPSGAELPGGEAEHISDLAGSGDQNHAAPWGQGWPHLLGALNHTITKLAYDPTAAQFCY
jgi:hypothetical protein